MRMEARKEEAERWKFIDRPIDHTRRRKPIELRPVTMYLKPLLCGCEITQHLAHHHSEQSIGYGTEQ